jgi:hypothetical protein
MAFTFGIYPSAVAGDDQVLVPPVTPDDPHRISAALAQLQGSTPEFLVRAYRPYAATVAPNTAPSPASPERYARDGRRLDLVLCFREPTGETGGWVDFVRETVRTSGPEVALIQICEEPNVNSPVLDGSTPNVCEAVVRGVVAAKQEARACGRGDLLVGFNAVPTVDPADTFWPRLGRLADERFHEALDYVGLDFFPDVFRPIAADRLAAVVAGAVAGFRRDSLPRAGIGAPVPIRICECGWSTGPGRSEQRQAEVLETAVRTLAGLRGELNLAGYGCFGLRDANSAGNSLFDGFGLLRDDYSPKPAFEAYRRLVDELSEKD